MSRPNSKTPRHGRSQVPAGEPGWPSNWQAFILVIAFEMIRDASLQTALLPNPVALIHLSAYLSSLHARDPTLFPGCPRTDDLAVLKSNDPPPDSTLSAQDLSDLREMREDLVRICTRAQARNIRVIVDAEYSWFQVRSARLLLSGHFTVDVHSAAGGRFYFPRSDARIQQRTLITHALAIAIIFSRHTAWLTTAHLCDVPGLSSPVSPRPFHGTTRTFK